MFPDGRISGEAEKSIESRGKNRYYENPILTEDWTGCPVRYPAITPPDAVFRKTGSNRLPRSICKGWEAYLQTTGYNRHAK
jgi:hypothetical protein